MLRFSRAAAASGTSVSSPLFPGPIPCLGRPPGWFATARSDHVLSLASVDARRGSVVGNVNLTRFSDDGCEAALGYWLVPGARGRGLASAAASTLANWGFEALGLESRAGHPAPECAVPSSGRATGSNTGGLRPKSHEAGGRWWDMEIYSLHAPNEGSRSGR